MDSDESDVYSEGNPKTDSDWEEESEIVVVDDDDEPPPSPQPPTPPPRRAARPRPPLPRHPAPRQPQPQPPPQPRPEAEERRNGGDGVICLFDVVISASPTPPSSPAVAAKSWRARIFSAVTLLKISHLSLFSPPPPPPPLPRPRFAFAALPPVRSHGAPPCARAHSLWLTRAHRRPDCVCYVLLRLSDTGQPRPGATPAL
ncbi:hypothetical protein ACP4OV_029467 [Aristida adscensionis]